MNPAKRKKLYRLNVKQNIEESKLVINKEEKVIQKEVITNTIQEQTIEVSNLELGLKTIDTAEITDSKKDKKKKTTTQEA